MIVDASAVLAVVMDEEEAARFRAILLSRDRSKTISPVNSWEIAARLDNLGDPDPVRHMRELLRRFGIEETTVDAVQTDAAATAQRSYGKNNHPARLNLGDCFAYALAKTRGEPLLFKGDDFSQTDVRIAR